MKLNKRILISAILVLVLAAGGAAAWYFLRDSDEVKIRGGAAAVACCRGRTLRDLCSLATKGSGEKAASGLLKIRQVESLFAPRCHFNFKHEMFSGELSDTEIASTLARFRALFSTVSVKMRGLEITVEPPDAASAVFTGILEGRMKDGRTVSEVRDLFCSLKRIDDRWKVDRITVREVLEM